MKPVLRMQELLESLFLPEVKKPSLWMSILEESWASRITREAATELTQEPCSSTFLPSLNRFPNLTCSTALAKFSTWRKRSRHHSRKESSRSPWAGKICLREVQFTQEHQLISPPSDKKSLSTSRSRLADQGEPSSQCMAWEGPRAKDTMALPRRSTSSPRDKTTCSLRSSWALRSLLLSWIELISEIKI